MLGTRPDITYAVTKLSQSSSNPSKEHMSKAEHICRYLNTTRRYSMLFDGSSDEGLIAFTDSDWATYPIKRRSITGYFFKVSWRHLLVAITSTENRCLIIHRG